MGADPFALAPGEARELQIVYTPESRDARADTLWVRSDDAGDPETVVLLEATEIPQNVGATRLILSRQDAIRFPQPGAPKEDGPGRNRAREQWCAKLPASLSS